MSTQKAKERRRSRQLSRLGRDTSMFLVGLLGIVHETVMRDVERPTLLIVFCGMIGLPIFFRADERLVRRDDDEV